MKTQYQERMADLQLEQNAALRSKEQAEREVEKLKRDLLETKNLAAKTQRTLMETAIKCKNALRDTAIQEKKKTNGGHHNSAGVDGRKPSS